MPTITLARTPWEKFAYFQAVYLSQPEHEYTTDVEILNAFLERNPDIPLEGLRDIVSRYAQLRSRA
jgi:hypothetical protein